MKIVEAIPAPSVREDCYAVTFTESNTELKTCLVTCINWFDDSGNKIKHPIVGGESDAKKVFLREYKKPGFFTIPKNWYEKIRLEWETSPVNKEAGL